jgi:GSCFA family
MTANPYAKLPPRANWRRSIARVPYSDVDPVSSPPFTVSRSDKVATAGSCFAQHIARHLQQSGFQYFVAETAHPIFPPHLANEFTYGVFSARYGNIYTCRQLLQLFDRAYGDFVPSDDHWEEKNGSFIDPFRPTCNPGGFASLEELRQDRVQHFAAVRRMFEELDIFVFTLGLTECWVSKHDGAAYPVCPGTAAGAFDAEKHIFVNFGVEECVEDMRAFLSRLNRVNPRARVILTVSPVPLVATMEERHVLASTTLSKSVLRVVADVISHDYPNVTYFESYEIITGSYNRGNYFAEDLRSVTEEGVSHVMRLFLKHYGRIDSQDVTLAPTEVVQDTFLESTAAAVAVLCDEVALNQD